MYVEMERWFFVEAKTFTFSVAEGASGIRVVERRKGHSGVVFLSFQCAEWLVSTVEVVSRSQVDSEFVKSFREGSEVFILRKGGNNSGRFLELAVYAVGGRKGLILIPEGREGRGWCRFTDELGKVLKISGSVTYPVKVKAGITVRQRIGSGGLKVAAEAGAPSFATVLNSQKKLVDQATKPCPMGNFKVPLVCQSSHDGGMGKTCVVGKKNMLVGDNSACLFGDNNVEAENFLGKRKMKYLLLEWKSQLLSLKSEVDRALFSVQDGLEKIGPGSQPTGAGRKKRGKRRKKWVVKPKPKMCKKPFCSQEGVSEAGMGQGTGLSTDPRNISPELTPEVEQIPATTGSSPARTIELGDTQIQPEGFSVGGQEVSIVPASVGRSPSRADDADEALPVSPVRPDIADGSEKQCSQEAFLVPVSRLAPAKEGRSPVKPDNAGGSSETVFCSEGSPVRSEETSGDVSFVPATVSEVRRAGFVPASPDDAGDPLFPLRLGQLGTQSSPKGIFASGEDQGAGFYLNASRDEGLASAVVCWRANEGLEEEGDGSPLRPVELDVTAPICSVPHSFKSESGYSNWVVRCAMEIAPIVGISCEDHQLQLLALLTFLEEERRVEALASPSKRDSKVVRELKKLEWSVNYGDNREGHSRGKGKERVTSICL
jgi:hypothetical protein